MNQLIQQKKNPRIDEFSLLDSNSNTIHLDQYLPNHCPYSAEYEFITTINYPKIHINPVRQNNKGERFITPRHYSNLK